MSTRLNIERMPNQLRLSWPAESGIEYVVQSSPDLKTWSDAYGPYAGEDDTMFTLTIPAPPQDIFHRLTLHFPEGLLVPARAITALSGRYVLLEWENLGPAAKPTAHYDVFRDGVSVGQTTHSDNRLRDVSVVSGATYRYQVRFFSS